jgi:hypothetical protein
MPVQIQGIAPAIKIEVIGKSIVNSDHLNFFHTQAGQSAQHTRMGIIPFKVMSTFKATPE